MNACYGETLDVLVRAVDGADGSSTEIILQLPDPARWSVGFSGGDLLNQMPCQSEPVAQATKVRIGFSRRLGPPEGYPATLRGMTITGGSAEKYRDTQHDGLAELIARDGLEVHAGFFRRNFDNDPHQALSGTEGVFKFPDTHKGPNGDPVYWMCTERVCQGEHRFLDSLIVAFKFWNKTPYHTDWVAQDAALQAMIAGWMKVDE